MKKELLKALKKQTRETQGPVPAPKVEPSKKHYVRKKKHPKKDTP
jgi:hypothetical protein